VSGPEYTVGARLPQSEYDAIEAWRRTQEIMPSMSRAIRHLIRLGLKADKEAKRE
jgi:hypothetical protein